VDTELESCADLILYSNITGLRFGASLALVDVNADGLLDLVVAAPQMGWDLLQYRGIIYIYFGQKVAQNTPIFNFKPDLIIYSTHNFTNMGVTSLEAADIDGDGHPDLIIGCPYASFYDTNGNEYRQSGFVSIFLSSAFSFLRRSTFSTNRIKVPLYIDVEANASIVIRGSINYEWFGFHSAATQDLLLIGAPGSRVNKLISVGQLYGYSIKHLLELAKKNREIDGSTSAKFNLYGQEFDYLASSFALGFPTSKTNPALALASPQHLVSNPPFQLWQGGEVIVIENLHLLQGSYNISNIKTRARLFGNEQFARFGSVVQFIDLDKDGYDELWASEPYREQSLNVVEVGITYMWRGSTTFPSRDIYDNAKSSDLCITSHIHHARFGSAIVVGDFNGDGLNDIIVSSSHDSTINHFGGSVNVFIAPFNK